MASKCSVEQVSVLATKIFKPIIFVYIQHTINDGVIRT